MEKEKEKKCNVTIIGLLCPTSVIYIILRNIKQKDQQLQYEI